MAKTPEKRTETAQVGRSPSIPGADTTPVERTLTEAELETLLAFAVGAERSRCIELASMAAMRAETYARATNPIDIADATIWLIVNGHDCQSAPAYDERDNPAQGELELEESAPPVPEDDPLFA